MRIDVRTASEDPGKPHDLPVSELRAASRRRLPKALVVARIDYRRPMAIRLAAFDLDGTLIRGQTCVVAIASAIGRVEECLEFEKLSMRGIASVTAARETMAGWYRHHAIDDLTRSLEELPLPPGGEEAFSLLRQSGVKTAIVSITWSFAVDWFAERLGADYAYGTRLAEDGIEHVWPPDKGRWLHHLAGALGLEHESVAAVGDSDGDRELLEAAGLRFFVGRVRPDMPKVIHLPDADLLTIAQRIVAEGQLVPSGDTTDC